jgi:hypothetical protein
MGTGPVGPWLLGPKNASGVEAWQLRGCQDLSWTLGARTQWCYRPRLGAQGLGRLRELGPGDNPNITAPCWFRILGT